MPSRANLGRSRHRLSMSRARRTSSRLPVAFLLLAACAAAPLPQTPHVSSLTVSASENGLRPAGDVAIEQFGTVVFRNARRQGAIEVAIEREFAPSANCSTTLQFAAKGDQSVSLPLDPGGVATLCFHEPGTFPFEIATPEGPLRGTVVVGGPQ